MTKLSDIQRLLLNTAAARDDGRLLPPPDQVADAGTRVRRTIISLIKLALVAEVDAGVDGPVWREEHGKRFGVVISEAGRAAIDAERAPSPVVAEPGTKIDTLLAMLRRTQGATLVEMSAATGWLPHTTRAALTRLRQKGHGMEKLKRDDATCYRIAAAA